MKWGSFACKRVLFGGYSGEPKRCVMNLAHMRATLSFPKKGAPLEAASRGLREDYSDCELTRIRQRW